MGDFDDISNILDDLANFDVSQFDTPQPQAPKPVTQPQQVQPQQPQPINTIPSFDDDFGMAGLDQFDTIPTFEEIQPLPTTVKKTPSNNNNNFNNNSFGTDFGMDLSDAALGIDFDLPPTDFDLPPTDIVVNNNNSGRRAPPSRAKAQTTSMQPINAQPINMQPMNAQPINMQAGNRPSPQPINMQPMNAQPINMQPMNAQPINMQTMNAQPINMKPMNAQPINMQPMNAQPINMQAGNRSSPQGPIMSGPGAMSGPGIAMSGPGSPMSGPGLVNPMMSGPGARNTIAGNTMTMQPMNAQPINMQPINAQPINMQPINAQPINMQAGNRPSPQPINMQPMNAQPINMQPMNAQPINMQPMNAQPINMQPMNRNLSMNDTINMQPMNMQPINMQPMNAQPINMQPMNSQNSISMQPMNLKPMTQVKKQKDIEDLDQTAEAFTFKEAEIEQEWPDPVKKEIVPRSLTEGREKLVLTLVLADKSTKKVFATDDFTISDLRDLFANKLHLWQTDFFNLCVKDMEEERWLDLRKTISEEKLRSGDEVLFKIKYFKTPKKLVDEIAIFLFYLQVKQNVVSSSYPCPEKLALRLAAHQVQINFGNYIPAKHRAGFMGDRLNDYLPTEIISENDPAYLEGRIYSLHKTLLGKSNKEVMEEYLEQAQQIQCYGSSIFWVKEKFGRTKKFAVAEDGVLISTDENPKRFNFISFKNLSNWKCTEDGFQIATIEPRNVLEFQATEFKSKSIIELMSGYYVFLLGVDPGELPLVRLPVQPEGLPNPKMFHKPNTALKRNISDITYSRLELFKESYMKAVKKHEIPAHIDLLTQIDTAIDQDLVLDVLDLSSSGFSQLDLRILSDSIATAYDYEPKEGEFFEENMTISTLNLSYNDLISGTDGADSLGKVFAIDQWQLKHIILKKIGLNVKAAIAMNSYLAKNIHLESLDVEDNDLKFKGVSSLLKPLKGQERCGTFNFNGNNLTGQVCFFLAQVLAKNQNVYELHIGNNKIDDKSLTNLVEGLKRNKSLTLLDVRSCEFGTGGGRLILKWLEEFHNLRMLYIGDNNLGSTWGSALVKLLQSGVCTLTALDVSKNGLNAKNIKGILEAIKETRSIRELDISFSEIDKKGATLLGDLISSRSVNLRKLFLRKCGLPKPGAIIIANALQQNTTIRELDYSGNEIKDAESGKAWGDAIKISQTIEILHLSGCGLNSDALSQIVPGLSKNTSLEKLYLDGNKLSKAITQLGEAIAGNTGLKYLSCKSIGFDANALTSLTDIIDGKNFTLKTLDLTDNGNLAKADLTPALKKISFNVRV